MKQTEDWHLTDALNYQHGRGDPFAAAVRATRMPMVITDPAQPDNPIVFCNEAFQTLTGYSREEIVGRNCRFLQGPETDQQELDRLRQAIREGRAINIDLLNYRKDGSTFWNALYMSPVYNDAGEIKFFFASQLDVSERVNAQLAIRHQKEIVEREVEHRTADLKAALEAKTLLLHEVDHRVKNNLTMIGSLLRLQARSINDPVITDKLMAMLERIDALAAVHRRLYQSNDITRFDVGAFAENLVTDVIGSSGRSDITPRCEVERIEVTSDKATPLGLILNELLVNAIKHAFANGRSGTLSLIARASGGIGSIEVTDDGPGMGDMPYRGLGRTLVDRLSRQVKAKTEWQDAHPGTRVTVSFPVEIIS
jgi:PAS domain S-box-containing protein